ncbi:MAG: histidine phosphatase family protein [Sedimenticola sp.]
MSSKDTILLARHGETEWNVKNKLQGHKNSPLTLNGKKQALMVKKRISHYKLHKAYVSPLKRAVDTLDIILGDREVEVVKLNELKEIRLGPWEGKTKEETEVSHPKEYEEFWLKPHKFHLAGAETFIHLQRRLASALSSIFAENPNKNILVVTHWIAIKAAVAYFTSTPLSQLPKLPDLNNGEYLLLIKDGESIKVTGLK